MQPTKLVHPTYSKRFRCIGSACEDICCRGWSIPIDQAAYEKYLGLPESALRAQIVHSIQLCAEKAVAGDGATNSGKPGGARPGPFAHIQLNGSDHCPLLNQDRLCRIQAELGEGFLAHACAIYPRIGQTLGGVQEQALTLSCPEAARLVLLSPDLLAPALPDRDARKGGKEASMPAEGREGESAPAAYFQPIRGATLTLIRNRAYPLWQRLFLLGIFCRRLDSIAKGKLKRSVPQFLRDFEAAVASGGLLTAMSALPVDRAAQLDAVLRLAGMLLHRSNVTPRFAECIQAFTAGIGNGPGATLESLTAQYTAAHDRYFDPYFSQHPQILENYLINTIVRCRFPFGGEAAGPDAAGTMTREFAILTAQFALMKGLLIGVAGFYRDGFSSAHVVHTVQAASKHFEHHPEFLNLAYKLLAESGLDGARGMAILLRNSGPAAGADEARPASPGISVPGPQAGKPASAQPSPSAQPSLEA